MLRAAAAGASEAPACRVRGSAPLARPVVLAVVVPRALGRRAAAPSLPPLAGQRRHRLAAAAANAASSSSSPSSSSSSAAAAAADAAANNNNTPAGGYSWSWADEQAGSSSPSLPLPPLPAGGAPFADAADALDALRRAAEVAAAESSSSLSSNAAAASGNPPLVNAAEWAAQFAAASPPQLFSASSSSSSSGSSAGALCAALAAAAALPAPPPARWLGAALLEPLGAALTEESGAPCGAKELASALWAASNLPLPLQERGAEDEEEEEGEEGNAATTTATTTTSAAITALRSLMAALEPQLQDLFAPDLARVVCAAGALARNAAGGGGGSSSSSSSALPATFAAAVVEEVTYQVTEFSADFGAYDLARLVSGLADLTAVVALEEAASAPLRAALSFPEQFSRALMDAVYARTSTIAERGAVDFALAKLSTAQEYAAGVAAAAGAASGEPLARRSLHFDPRWTHEEMSACGWLPRHARDKKRIIKRDWQRTQWVGF